jgi:hypothetical protein
MAMNVLFLAIFSLFMENHYFSSLLGIRAVALIIPKKGDS